MKRATAALLALFLVAGCAASTRHKALTGTMTGLNLAQESFVAWDREHQLTIVDNATSREDGETKLKAYRVQREKLYKAFVIAYTLLAAAMRDPGDTALYLEAMTAAKQAYDLTKELVQ